MARVYIGIPTFNRPHFVQDAVRSVLAQTGGDFRIVVSDNCSDGDTPERLARYVAGLGDPRVRFHQQPTNVGEYGQGRFFLADSGGSELLAILHDDDVFEPEYLATAIAAMDAHPEASFFVAGGYAMDPDGRRSPSLTTSYQRSIGRIGAPPGLFDVLDRHMSSGFAPISGTLFRRDALMRSGFVDPDCHGNYPFEANIFLRLGEIHAQAWFDPREMLGVRMHPGAMRMGRIFEDPALVGTAIRMWRSRRFSGANERRRRAVLSRYYRAQAMILLRTGDLSGAQAALRQALTTRPMSARAWAAVPSLFLFHGRLGGA